MTAAHFRQAFALVLFALATAQGSVAAVAARNDGPRTLTILAARCPAGYVGDASADECDDTPMPDVLFRVGRPYTDFVITGRTDTEGIVTFEITDLPYRGTVRVIEELPPGTARVVASCVDDAGTPLTITDEPLLNNDPPIAAALVTVRETGNVRCDWYTVPVS